MGLFSLNTSDTKKSIPNCYSIRPTFTVYMLTPGKVYKEESYGGNGYFGGKDFYLALYEMNASVYGDKLLKGRKIKDIDVQEQRDNGINKFFNKTLDYKVHMPKIVENLEEALSMNFEDIPDPTDCEYQGHFYPELDIYG